MPKVHCRDKSVMRALWYQVESDSRSDKMWSEVGSGLEKKMSISLSESSEEVGREEDGEALRGKSEGRV